MRGFLGRCCAAALLLCWTTISSSAAPVAGFEALYAAVLSSCSSQTGSVVACENAIIAYADALVGVVDIAVATQSFTELRADLLASNSGQTVFQASVDALFDQLLPEVGAVGDLGLVGPLPLAPS